MHYIIKLLVFDLEIITIYYNLHGMNLYVQEINLWIILMIKIKMIFIFQRKLQMNLYTLLISQFKSSKNN